MEIENSFEFWVFRNFCEYMNSSNLNFNYPVKYITPECIYIHLLKERKGITITKNDGDDRCNNST